MSAERPTIADATAGPPGPPGLRRFLVRGGLWAFAGRLATVAAALGVHALVAHLLPPPEVGRFFLLYSVVLVARTIGGLGLGRTVVRKLGQVDAAGHPERAPAVLSPALALVTGGGLAVATLLATAPGAAALDAVGASTSPQLRWLVALWSLALVFEGLTAESFRGLHRIAHATTFNGLFSSGLLMVGLAVWRQVGGSGWQPQIRHIVLTATVAAGLSAAIGLTRLMTTLPRHATTPHRPGTPDTIWRGMLQPSLPILASTLIALLVDQLGLWLLGVWSNDPSQLALFGTAQRLARLVAMPLMVANGVLPPIMARLDRRGDRLTLTATLRLSASLTLVAATAGTAILIGLGAPLMGTVFGTFYQQAAATVTLLAIGQLIAVGCGSCGVMLLMSGQQRVHLAISLVTLGLVLAGGTLLRGSIDAWRMAWVLLVAGAVQQIACLVAVHRRTGVWTSATFSPRRARDYWRRLATE